ncbi:MAG: hypothetical protein ACE5EG_06675, partial [Thermoanaerobaculia bacterium]
AAARAQEPEAAEVVARYLAARGGAQRWRELGTLELTGIYAAFSFHEPFRLIRKRGDWYRLDYVVLGTPAIRARDGQGPWGQDPLLQPEAAHIAEDPYKSQLERESLFGLALLDHESKGIAVELIGEGEVEGQATVDLRLTFPGERQEIWHLDADSWLEVAVDAEVWDYTQGTAPMRRRTFFDDFREVDGLVLPFQVDHEFGARLEAMTVEAVRVDTELDDEEYEPPPPAPPAGGEEPAAGEAAENSAP